MEELVNIPVLPEGRCRDAGVTLLPTDGIVGLMTKTLIGAGKSTLRVEVRKYILNLFRLKEGNHTAKKTG